MNKTLISLVAAAIAVAPAFTLAAAAQSPSATAYTLPVAASTSSTPLDMVDETTFDQVVVKSKLPVLMEFSSTTCGYCKDLEPRLQKLAHDYAGKLKVVKIDIDDSPAIARSARVQGTPTMFLLPFDTAKGALNPHSGSRLDGDVDMTTLKQFVDTGLSGK